MGYTLVLWDFDGTVVDTSQGIFESLRYAFSRMELPPPPDTLLCRFIGPPLKPTFEQVVGLSAEQAERAVALYREDYRGRGLFRAKVYEGLPELVGELRERGIKQAIATLKPEHMARQLLTHFGIEGLFDVCCGTQEQNAHGLDKTQIIRIACEKLGRVPDARTVMIGDTGFDERGARGAGIDFVAAAYGYGYAVAGEPLPPDAPAAEHIAQLRTILLGG